MKSTSQKIIPMLSISALLIFTACSSKQVVATSDLHPYTQNIGMVSDPHADAIIEQEYLSMNQATEIEMPVITDPEISTELQIDPDAFLAEEYVQQPPVITYKYKFDPKFYSKPEWRIMDLE